MTGILSALVANLVVQYAAASPYAPRPWKSPRFKIGSSCKVRLHDKSAFQCKCLAGCHPDKESSTNLKCSLGIRQIISLPTRWPSNRKNYQCHIDDCGATSWHHPVRSRAATGPLLRGGIKSFLSRLSAQSSALSSNLAPAQRPN